MVWCGRMHQGSIATKTRVDNICIGSTDDPLYAPPGKTQSHAKAPRNCATKGNWLAFSRSLFRDGRDAHLQRLAERLGVSKSRSRPRGRLGRRSSNCWTFPSGTRSGKSSVSATRQRDGSKKRMLGGSAGLTYADGWDTGDGPILLVEGGSDTAALMTIGLNVVGRPSNRGGVDNSSIY